MRTLFWGMVMLSTSLYGMETRMSDQLREALMLGDKECVEVLVSDGIYDESFIIASLEGHLHIVTSLIDKVSDINCKNSVGQTALMVASAAARVEVVRFLIAEGATVDLQDGSGLTALMLACCANCYNVADLLIKHGADVQVTTKAGHDALMFVVGTDDVRLVKLLIKEGVSIVRKDMVGRTAFDYAKERKNYPVIEELEKCLGQYDNE